MYRHSSHISETRFLNFFYHLLVITQPGKDLCHEFHEFAARELKLKNSSKFARSDSWPIFQPE